MVINSLVSGELLNGVYKFVSFRELMENGYNVNKEGLRTHTHTQCLAVTWLYFFIVTEALGQLQMEECESECYWCVG